MEIRCVNIHKDKREEFESIGFLFEIHTNPLAHGWDLIKLAFETFKALNSDRLMNQLFLVPTEDAQWPSDTWGMRLGLIVKNIKVINTYAVHREDVIAMGIVSKHW
jgi:hypothetical protein